MWRVFLQEDTTCNYIAFTITFFLYSEVCPSLSCLLPTIPVVGSRLTLAHNDTAVTRNSRRPKTLERSPLPALSLRVEEHSRRNRPASNSNKTHHRGGMRTPVHLQCAVGALHPARWVTRTKDKNDGPRMGYGQSSRRPPYPAMAGISGHRRRLRVHSPSCPSISRQRSSRLLYLPPSGRMSRSAPMGHSSPAIRPA